MSDSVIIELYFLQEQAVVEPFDSFDQVFAQAKILKEWSVISDELRWNGRLTVS